MLNYSKISKLSHIKYSLLQFYNKFKLKILITSFLLVVFLLTGIFTALKISNLDDVVKKIGFSFEAILDGDIYSFSFFIKRCLSFLLVLGILYIFSLNKFLNIFGIALLCYRMFLLALNVVLIIRFIGIGSVIIAILIILPCQLIQLLLLSCMFFIFCAIKKDKKQCGFYSKNYLRCILYLIIASLIVNLIELLLLIIFKATTILVI